ncbi:MAG: glycosyl hydrolase 2 galactose-binding domain-containing protein [Acutalibacteraceae bacterium]
MKRSLNGEWKFKAQDGTVWKNACVPGCNYLDLMSNGDIPDPFVGLNEKEVSWVARKNWEYMRSFTVTPEELESDDILLNCMMLDTICDVYINEKHLFHGDNCFTPYSESVRDFLKEGENTIKIVFVSPVNYVEKMYKKCPTPVNANGQNGVVHIRKPQCHFGWDWGPVLPCSGISGDIELEFVQAAKFGHLSVVQTLDGDKATVRAEARISSFGEYECEIALVCPNGETLVKKGEKAEFSISSPELWWTHELSGKERQPIYTVKARLISGGREVDACEKKTGIRKLELRRNTDEYGRNFQFVLNGVPLFIKGANFIPADSFITRVTHEKLARLTDAAVFSNMNMLRIWGGGYYGSDELYSLCDEKGILLWQDFQFACQAYPFFDDEFLSNVKREIACNVRRLSHHPSLAVWCGNNEIEEMHMSWAHMKKYVDWTEKFFYHILEDEIRKYDSLTPYTPGSPVGVSHNRGVDSDNVGDTHLWGVWHGLKPMNYYRSRMTRFCSEFGFESLPDIKAIKKFAPSGGYNLSSDVLKAHQKCANGNDKMLYYIASRFDLPKKFEDLIYLSQVTQNECIADATEHWRRNKGRCNGALYWQFNDCWGVCSWSGIDYYGNYKALQYGARRFNAPLSVSIEDSAENIRVFVINDLNENRKAEVGYEIFDFETGTLESDTASVSVGAFENICAFETDVSLLRKKYDLKRTGFAVRLRENGLISQEKTLLFGVEKKLKLPKAKLETTIKKEKDGVSVTVKTDKFARLVCVESSISSQPFSDNFFDLLPGESKTVTIKCGKGLTPDELAESIRAYCLTDVDFDKSPLRSAMKRLKVYLSPVNIANAVYHGKKVKDAKLD